jgi:hypothetical protein
VAARAAPGRAVPRASRGGRRPRGSLICVVTGEVA